MQLHVIGWCSAAGGYICSPYSTRPIRLTLPLGLSRAVSSGGFSSSWSRATSDWDLVSRGSDVLQ